MVNDSGVTVEGDVVRVQAVSVDDPLLAGLLRAQPEEQRVDLVVRALSVGARGLLTMGLGVDLAEVDARVRRSVEDVTGEARRSLETILEQARRELAGSFDPEHRSSATARALAEFGVWRDGLMRAIDPAHRDSHTARFLGELDAMLRDALDPTATNTGLGRLATGFDAKFAELRDLLMMRQGRANEAERGTQKGFDFETEVEERLRAIAHSIGSCVVERTSRTPGDLAGGALVGDFVLTLPDSRRIVVEAKNSGKVALHGRDGILAELEGAMVNRGAHAAICVSAHPAFPGEVGSFGIYGNRVLVVDEDDGTLLDVAIRVAALLGSRDAGVERSRVDLAAVGRRLQSIRELAQQLAGSRRSLTDVTKSVEQVQTSLGSLRATLLALVDEAMSELERPQTGAAVVELSRREVG